MRCRKNDVFYSVPGLITQPNNKCIFKVGNMIQYVQLVRGNHVTVIQTTRINKNKLDGVSNKAKLFKLNCQRVLHKLDSKQVKREESLVQVEKQTETW